MGSATNPKIKVVKVEKDLSKAIRLINKFQNINDLKIKYSITFDYTITDYGLFYEEEKNNIIINPKAFFDTTSENPHALYYSEDFNIQSVAIHEFGHLIVFKFGIKEKYKTVFNTKFVLNDNSKKDIDEEIVEQLRLFFLNPYFFKLIAPDRFEFFQGLFKSPSPITKKSFIVKYKTWNPEIHRLCLERWSIKVLGNRVFVG